MSDGPTPRAAARVLLLDPTDRVLLVRFDDRATNYAWWATPGGGIGPGETPEAAAVREVAEETGLSDLTLGPCVWVRQFEFTWSGRRILQHERFYAARVPVFEPNPAGFESYELELLPQYRWWSVAEIQDSRERFGPRRLGFLLADLLTNGFPEEPIDVGR
jgi:8-oxo-dGTP pyrophosphatase MutT (NUDIX family)